MARKISEALGLSANDLERVGGFDGFVDIDAQFHVDPHLLDSSAVPEMVSARATLLDYFEEIIQLIGASSSTRDALSREARRRLTFPEIPYVGLGYTAGGRAGSGIGDALALQLTQTAHEIVSAGIRDPVIFELVGLFEEGIGADRVSDMVISITLPHFLDFSSRVVAEFGLNSREVRVGGRAYAVPRINGDPLILVPKDVLRHLPVAEDWSEIDIVCAHNSSLRARLNTMIGETWKDATKRISKSRLKEVLLNYPEALQDLIAQYRSKPAEPYDFARDPVGKIVWHEVAQDYTARFPLSIPDTAPLTTAELVEIVLTIVDKYGTLIEENGLWRHLYNESGGLRHERYAQLLFYAIADSYCQANNVDLSREPNAGNGPVDFKLSHGYTSRVLVEIKYSRNTHLIRSYRRQLSAYRDAERGATSIYLIIRTTESIAGIDEVRRLQSEALDSGEEAPQLVVVDGRPRQSASRR